ncbi:MAG: cell division protein SepF [Candidatus Aenigmarchaeota archaeon]|nr:cell division protein SepF [Candidatus Aenigmarchaeota archaeon]
MPIKLFSRREEPQDTGDDFVEVDSLGLDEKRTGSVAIRIEKLNDFEDTEKILKAIRNGNIVFLQIKRLKEKDIGELKRAVDKLKKTITANNGDIVGIEQDWLILTPDFARVERE